MNNLACTGSVLAMSLLLSGCSERPTTAAQRTQAVNHSPSENPAAAAATPATHGWLGEWRGPEGTSLFLAMDGDRYAIKIQSLDGTAVYAGIGMGDRIQFTRDGKTEYLQASSGKDTGMKWLREKSDCLAIRPGEGFCRD